MRQPRWLSRLVLGLALASPSAVLAQSEEGPETTQPAAPACIMSVRGLVVDAVEGTPVAGAKISIGGRSMRSGADGTFTMPTGTRAPVTVRVDAGADFEPASQEVIQDPAACGADEIFSVMKKVVSSAEASEVIEVTSTARRSNQSSEAITLLKRQNRAEVSDAISAEEMSKTPDSNAAAAVKRVVSATVVGGRYLFVRGLGGRYVSTLLNGVPLPSPEPDKQAVPLDIFPTRLLSNLTILKSYDSSLPGRFGGGTMAIETRSFPEDFQLKLSASSSANSAVALGDGQTYGGGNLDFLGFDDGTRALPDRVPGDGPVVVGPGMTSTEAEAIAESFDNRWSTRKRTIRPNLSLGATVGDTVRVKGKRLGYLATGGYRRGYQTREALVAKVRNIDGDIGYREEMDSVMSQSSTRVGGLFNVGLEAAKGHEIGAFALYTHTGDDTATTVRGFNETDGQDIEASRLRFVERSLAFAQIYGNHAFGRRAQLRWQGNLGHTGRSEPDTRDITYNLIAGSGQARFKSEPGSGERLFAELGEMTLGTGSTLKLESEMADLTLGAIVQGSSRTFDARRFRYVYVGSDPGVLFLPPEQMFSDTNLGPDFELRERTLPTDRYGGSLLVAAGFARSEMRMSDRLRFIVGGRFEASRQNLDSLSPFAAGDAMRVEVEQNDDNFLTALSSVYALSKAQNLRLAYGSTLARPQFRELAPFLFFDTTRRRSVSGNPDLVNTRIHNVDLRWEWFPGVSEVVSAGLFGKYFVDPIEQVIVSASGGDVSYDNAASATALGAEIEGRVDLERLWAPLTGLRLGANAAIVRSRIELTDEQLMSQTSKQRPMQGQSPFAINLNLGYQRGAHQAMALYNVSGRRIVEVGFDSLPDVYEQPRHTVDLTYGYQLKSNLRVKASAQNLLAQRLTLQQGELAVYQFQPGVSVGLGLEWIP